MEQGSHNGAVGHHAGKEVHEGEADAQRQAVRLTRQTHQAAVALNQQIVARLIRQGAGAPIAGDRTIDNVRLEATDCRISQAHALQRAGPKTLDEDVGVPHQGQHNVDGLRRLQVQGQATLVAVKGEKLGALPVPKGRPGTGLIPPFWLLDLDDVGAHVAQHHGAEGASQGAGQVHHFDIL